MQAYNYNGQAGDGGNQFNPNEASIGQGQNYNSDRDLKNYKRFVWVSLVISILTLFIALPLFLFALFLKSRMKKQISDLIVTPMALIIKRKFIDETITIPWSNISQLEYNLLGGGTPALEVAGTEHLNEHGVGVRDWSQKKPEGHLNSYHLLFKYRDSVGNSVKQKLPLECSFSSTELHYQIFSAMRSYIPAERINRNKML